MKGRLEVTVASVAMAIGAMVVFPSLSAPATGIITSVSGSATISTEGMSPGGEIRAFWYSLPPGKAVAEPAISSLPGKWTLLEMALGGSAVVTGDPAPMCQTLLATGRHAEGPEAIANPGDVQACNYAILPGRRTENHGSEPYVRADVIVGGPWNPQGYSMDESPDRYARANGLATVFQVAPSQFGEVEKEILSAGAMTVTIRQVTMPPGARVVTTDRYPTLRMVENGRLSSGTLPAGSDPTAEPKVKLTRNRFDLVGPWGMFPNSQIVLWNAEDQPVEFVEWSVAPAQGVKP